MLRFWLMAACTRIFSLAWMSTSWEWLTLWHNSHHINMEDSNLTPNSCFRSNWTISAGWCTWLTKGFRMSAMKTEHLFKATAMIKKIIRGPKCPTWLIFRVGKSSSTLYMSPQLQMCYQSRKSQHLFSGKLHNWPSVFRSHYTDPVSTSVTSS